MHICSQEYDNKPRINVKLVIVITIVIIKLIYLTTFLELIWKHVNQ